MTQCVKSPPIAKKLKSTVVWFRKLWIEKLEAIVSKTKRRIALSTLLLSAVFIVFSQSSVKAASTSGRTALQDHVDFFDRNNDRLITVGETAEGLRALGIGWTRSYALAYPINAGLGRATGASWYSPLTVHSNNIHLGKHRSDTDVYDQNGHFVRANFEKIFRLYDKDSDNALSEDEFGSFFAGYKTDTVGSVASRAEFGLLLEIAGQDKQVSRSWWWSSNTERVITRDALQRFYDGTLFYTIAGEPVPFRVR
jgi:peroxygenase